MINQENVNVHVLSARKKPVNKSSNYIISLNKRDFDRKSQYCVGKLRSNFVGTEFKLYDPGENPKNKSAPQHLLRKELALIQYVY